MSQILDKVENKTLNDAIKALNDMKDGAGNPLFTAGNRVPYIGKKKEERLQLFTEAYENLLERPDAKDLGFPKDVLDFYSWYYADELDQTPAPEQPKTEPVPAPEPAPEPVKTAEPAPEPVKEKPKLKARYMELVTEGKHTVKAIKETLQIEFPDKAKSTINTYVTDSQSEKYAPKMFGPSKRVQKDANGILTWIS